jgi:hypothetical protein
VVQEGERTSRSPRSARSKEKLAPPPWSRSGPKQPEVRGYDWAPLDEENPRLATKNGPPI